MEFQVEREALAEATTWAARNLPGRPTVPILAGMLLEADQGLCLSSFDYETSAQARLDVTVDTPGRALVSGRLLAEIVRSLPPRTVHLSSDGAKVTVRCGSTRFKLQTLPIEDYPSLPVMPRDVGVVGSDVFAHAVAQAAIAAGRDETLPMLTGMYVEARADRLTLVCTDRYRIAVRELPWTPVDPEASFEVLVPAKIMAQTAKSVSANAMVTIAVDEGGSPDVVGLECGGRRTTSRALDGQFIQYRSHLPSGFTTTAEVPTGPFMEAIKRVSLVADRNTPVRLSFQGDEVVLEAATGEEAQAVEVMDARRDGEEVSIAFNPTYLVDGLAALDSDTAVLHCRGPLKPAMLTGKTNEGEDTPDYRYVVMPIRLAQ